MRTRHTKKSASAKPAYPKVTPAPSEPPHENVGTKATILMAALEVFARHGFDGASLPKIAIAANVGHPLIHYHFGSKDNLWREAVAFSVGGLLAQAAAIDLSSSDIPPIERSKVLIGAFALFAAQYPSHVAIFMFEMRTRSERLTWLLDNYIQPFVAQVTAVFVEAQSNGQIKDIPAENLISIFTGAIVSYFSMNLQPRPDRSIEDLASEHANYVVDVLMNGILLNA